MDINKLKEFGIEFQVDEDEYVRFDEVGDYVIDPDDIFIDENNRLHLTARSALGNKEPIISEPFVAGEDNFPRWRRFVNEFFNEDCAGLYPVNFEVI